MMRDPIDDAERGAILLRLAREALEERLLGRACPPAPGEAWLDEPAASFVTLTEDGALRGCIGSLEASRPLREDVRANAVAAALKDPRFPPVRAEDLEGLRIELSLLSPPEPLPAKDEAEALARIRPGVDGLVLEHRHGRGTFLPQVWEQLPRRADFLRQLKRKAGLRAETWSADIRLLRYTARKWKEALPEREARA